MIPKMSKIPNKASCFEDPKIGLKIDPKYLSFWKITVFPKIICPDSWVLNGREDSKIGRFSDPK